jgi:hypothetical protein
VRNALIREMASKDSVFENVRIDPDEIEIKRLLDHEVLKSASFIRSFETVIIIDCSMRHLTQLCMILGDW